MLAKTHGEKSKKVRKAKKTPASKGCPTLTEDYNKADDLVSLVYVDICNGASRSDVIQKLQLGEYGNKPIKARQSAYYYNAALDRFAVDTDIEAEKLRDMFYARYETILAECMKRNDVFNARATLDSMAKIFLGVRDGNQTNIQVNSDKDGGITINFGFDNNTQDDSVVDSEYEEA
jgi:hypothetical protein